MNRVPFSPYDFFGYLASGFLFLAGISVVTGQSWLLSEKLPASALFFATFGAYIAGHVMAQVSSSLLEHLVARGLLETPERILINPPGGHRLRRRIFPGYYRPMPEAMRERVRQKALGKGWGTDERAIFLQGLTVVRRETVTAGRLDSFLNLYGFARNTAMVFLLAALGVAILVPAYPGSLKWWLLGISSASGAVMFYRFLKFYRLYTYEVFANVTEVP